MNSFVVAFCAVLAVAQASVIGLSAIPSAKVIQGPSSRTTVVGNDGSVISSVSPGGSIITENHAGVVAHAAPAVVAAPVAVAHSAPVVAAPVAVAHSASVVAHPAPAVVAAPVAVAHSAPAVIAAPAVHTVSHHSSVIAHGAPVAVAHSVPAVVAAPAVRTVAHQSAVIAHGAPVAVAHSVPAVVSHAVPVAHASPVVADAVIAGPSGTVVRGKSHLAAPVVAHHAVW